MIYSSPEFIIFFTATTLLYFIFHRSFVVRTYLLLFSSLFFYAWAGLFDFMVFLLVMVVAWLSAAVAKEYRALKRLSIAVGITILGAHLFFWKYFPWLYESALSVFPEYIPRVPLDLPLPIGISFFTLQGIAYLVDVYRDDAEVMPFTRFALFKSFFPQLVAGPIVRSRQLIPQLEALRIPDANQILCGISLFSIGLGKKLAIADRLGQLADPVFANPSAYSGAALLQALLAYTFQIWADFSGYVDMGRGAGHILGISLPENFLSPYLAKTPSEFWKRWHITLSQWIRDYIYIPLGGNQGSHLRVVVVALLTMVISGLWHGAAMTFLIWGFYHGVLLVLERYLKFSKIGQRIRRCVPSSMYNAALIALTFLSVVVGWLIFRIRTLENLTRFIEGLASKDGLPFTTGTSEWYLCVFFSVLYQIVTYYSFSKRRFLIFDYLPRLSPTASSSPIQQGLLGSLIGVAIASLLVAAVLLRVTENSIGFIYFQF